MKATSLWLFLVILSVRAFGETVASGEVCYDLGKALTPSFEDVNFSPDSKSFVGVGKDRSVALYFTDGRPPIKLRGPDPNEEFIEMHEWDPKTGKLFRDLLRKVKGSDEEADYYEPVGIFVTDPKNGKTEKLKFKSNVPGLKSLWRNPKGALIGVKYKGDQSNPDSIKELKLYQETSGGALLTLTLNEFPECANLDLDLSTGVIVMDGNGQIEKLFGHPKGKSPTKKVLGRAQIPKDIIRCQIDEAGQRVVVMTKSGNLITSDFKGKTQSFGKVSNAFSGGRVNSDRVKYKNGVLVFYNSDGELVSHNFSTGETHQILSKDVDGSIESLENDGRLILEIEDSSNIHIIDAKTGKQLEHYESIDEYCSPKVIFNNPNSVDHRSYRGIIVQEKIGEKHLRAVYRDQATGKKKVVGEDNECLRIEDLSPDGKYVATFKSLRGGSWQTEVGTYEPICFDPKVVHVQDACMSCQNPEMFPLPVSDKTEQWLRNFVSEELCKREFKTEEWDKLVPPVKAPGAVPDDKLAAYLMRFQKPGGLVLSRDLPALRSILASELGQEHLEFAQNALQNVLVSSPKVYRKLVDEFPWLKEFPKKSSPRFECRSEKEKKIIVEAADNFVVNQWPSTYSQTHQNEAGEAEEIQVYPQMEFKDWMHLAPLASVLKELPKEKKEEYRDFIAETLQSASSSTSFRNVFSQRIYKFGYNASAQFFGEEPKLLTDLSIERVQRGFRPVVLSSHRIDDNEKSKTSLGFYVLEKEVVPWQREDRGLEEVKVGDTFYEKEFSWRTSGKTYSGKIRAVYTGESKIRNHDYGEGPDYEQAWEDKQLVGVFIVGSNLQSERKDAGLEFIQYFKNQDFEIKGEQVSDLKSFVKSKTTASSGYLDYIADQSHAGGSEKNVVAISDKYKMMTAHRKLPDGKSETFHFLYPEDVSQDWKYIGHNEFADWIREREKTNNKPLTHISISCNSKEKELYTLEAANSKLLVPIASNANTQTFANDSKNSVYRIIDGLRNGKNFKELSEGTSPFLLPGQRGFKEEIMDRVMPPTRFEVSVFDEKGNEIHLDNQNLN